MEYDIIYMKRCIEIASKEIGNTYPNPLVGCVIVHENKIIGEGSHKKYGDKHAEVNAINSVDNKDLLRNSSLYVNLEPCNHFGKTPPCTDLIIKYKIQNIIIGSRDPNSLVEGGGVERLKSKGCNVKYGVLQDECDCLNKRFFTYHKLKRPYIILKWAESKDGFITPIKSQREVFKISGDESLKLSHTWRKEENSILVGVQTIIDDDPKLTTRLVKGKNPIRIVLDSKGTLSDKSKILQTSDKIKTIIVVSKKITKSNYNKLNKFPVELIVTGDSSVNIKSLLRKLFTKKIKTILVEGGGTINWEFIKHNIFDELIVTLSPFLVGGNNAISFVEGDGFDKISKSPNLRLKSVKRLKNHLVLHYAKV